MRKPCRNLPKIWLRCLVDFEEAMELRDLLNKPLPKVPFEILERIGKSKITKTPFESKNDILCTHKLQEEIGYVKMDDGTYLVSMVCPMTGITVEMIEWWFWWHAQDSLRYRVWYPDEHTSIRYHRKDKAYFEQPTLPMFAPNTQYPTEKIGGIKMPLRIDFVTPEKFGFSRTLMNENTIPLIVCGHVSAYDGLVKHTEMAHIFKQTENGLFMISRFWLGKTMHNAVLRRLIITESMARSMTKHCCIEYRNLCEILPALYKKHK